MILYRTSGPWGGGVGANLTPAQVDGNFYDVAMRVQYLELNPAAPVQITSFSSVGNQLYIHMSNGIVSGPLTLPTVRWNFRGNWAPTTVYVVDDVVIAPDSAVYLVIFSHTSANTFSPGANDGQAHNYYSLLLRVPAASIPAGGARGTVLTKISDNNYDLSWTPPKAPPGGFDGQVLRKYSDADGDADWRGIGLYDLTDVNPYYNPLNDGDYLRWSWAAGKWVNQARPIFNVVTASSWYPVVGDEGNFMVLDNATADALIAIPHSSVQNFPIGSELHVHQDGTGRVRIEGDPGVTILKHASFSNYLLGQYATVTVKKTNTNEWRLFGLLAGAT